MTEIGKETPKHNEGVACKNAFNLWMTKARYIYIYYNLVKCTFNICSDIIIVFCFDIRK